jgi:hypothetical protein
MALSVVNMPKSNVKFPQCFFHRATLLFPLSDGNSARINGGDTTRSQALSAVDVLAENQKLLCFSK